MLNATNFARWLFVGVGSKPTVTGEERRAGLLIIEYGWTDPRGERTARTEGKIRIRTREPRMRKINPREMRYQREEGRDCPRPPTIIPVGSSRLFHGIIPMNDNVLAHRASEYLVRASEICQKLFRLRRLVRAKHEYRKSPGITRVFFK